MLIGQSLGGAVLVHALSRLEDRSRVRAVVLEGTFHSYQDVAGGILWKTGVLAPFAGMGYALVSDDLAPWRVIGSLSPIPVVVVHDVGDPTIPFEYGAALYRLARQPKEFWAVDQGKHIRAFEEESLRFSLIRFLEGDR